MAKRATKLAIPPEVEEAADVGPLHNQPPEPIGAASLGMEVEEWVVWLARVFEQPAKRKEELLASFRRFVDGFELRRASTPGVPPIGLDQWDDDVAGRAGDLRDKFADLIKAADSLHQLEKAPILRAARAVDGFKNNFVADLNQAVLTIGERLTVYLKWKQEVARKAATEEAERKEAEARALAEAAAAKVDTADLDQLAEAFGQAADARAAASAPVADLARTRGPLGSVSTLHGVWKFYPEQSNLRELVKAVAAGKAPLDFLTFNEKRIGFAVRSEKLREAPGLHIDRKLKA